MKRSTGFLVFSFLVLLPLKLESKVQEQPCPPGKTWSDLCNFCVDDPSDCHATQTLHKSEEKIYSLEEGVLVKCEEKDHVLVPAHAPSNTNGTTYWTCHPK